MIDFSSEELFEFLIAEAEVHFSGWDFSYIADRESQAPLRWSYVSEALLRVRKSRAVLDMDTGGGEIFSYFAPFPATAYATEAYAPNIPIARERLEPLGVVVIPLDEEEPDGRETAHRRSLELGPLRDRLAGQRIGCHPHLETRFDLGELLLRE